MFATGVLLFSTSFVASEAHRRWKKRGGPIVQLFHRNPPLTINLESCCTVSAPGKVLIAGGYLVLERPNVGVTISSTSRFYSTVMILQPLPKGAKQSPPSVLSIVVESPQFYSSFEYEFDVIKKQLVCTSSGKNEFVEKCLFMVLAFAIEALGQDQFASITEAISQINGKLGVKLRADNDFYSQIKELRKRSLPFLSSSLQKLQRFSPCPRDDEGKVEVNKTGMGSSAALTTSLVGALLQWFGIIRLGMRKGDDDRQIVHNLAQLAHAVAQGKIGSGFDVAAAVYGTQLYRRFAADNDGLSACLSANVSSAVIHAAVKNAALWTQSVSAFSLPQSLDIVMGDVCGGSSSASMAREVLKWRKDDPVAAEKTWKSLAEANAKIYDALCELSIKNQLDSTAYHEAIASAAELTVDKWKTTGKSPKDSVMTLLVTIRQLFKVARGLLRHMGEGAGVEIVPPQQLRLAEATEELPGVLCAGLPGAGGHDAIFAITLSAAARKRVETKWSDMSHSENGTLEVCPLMLRAEGGMKSGVRAEFEMVRWD